VDGGFLKRFKLDVMSHVLPEASAVLTDPEYGSAKAISSGILTGNKGLLQPLEVTDYTPHPSQRETTMIPGWGVGKIKRMGSSGVKLLLYYHPEAANAAGQRAIVEQVVAQCQQHDIPFFLEPIAYSLNPGQPLSSAEKRVVVVESARTFSTMGVDVLKVEFPLQADESTDEAEWADALEELNEACGVPWALLSAGVGFTTFARQTALACKHGASGVIVGRAVWGDAVPLHPVERIHFLATVGAARMAHLAVLCGDGNPWFHRVRLPRDLPEEWYTLYDTL
jgi:tagatose-1,6-bisphosphate aldolase